MPDEPQQAAAQGMGLRQSLHFPEPDWAPSRESLDKEWRVASDGEGVMVAPGGGAFLTETLT